MMNKHKEPENLPEGMMVPYEVEQRLDDGEDPLDLSIEKYWRIRRDCVSGGVNWVQLIYSDTCGLCLSQGVEKTTCEDCILETEGIGCNQTASPWDLLEIKRDLASIDTLLDALIQLKETGKYDEIMRRRIA